MSEITQKQVQSLFDYKDGNLFWKENRARGKVKAGDKAGCFTSHGYKRLMIGYKEYATHRVVFLYHHGYLPKMVDHIDGNPLNNNIENLRESDSQSNQYNRRKSANNTSGCKNVSWNAKGQTWQIHIRHKKKVHSWYVKDFELAELIAKEARTKFHGAFVNHG
jgi:HNH endonuclease